VSQVLTLWQRTLQRSPHAAAQLELLEQSTAQSLPQVAEQVLTDVHSGLQPSPHRYTQASPQHGQYPPGHQSSSSSQPAAASNASEASKVAKPIFEPASM
jgi:hypothetical protein